MYMLGLSEGARLVVHYLGYTGGGSGQEVGGINEGVVIPTASVDVEPEDVTWLKVTHYIQYIYAHLYFLSTANIFVNRCLVCEQ